MASSSSVSLPSTGGHHQHDASSDGFDVEAVDVDQIQAVSIHRKRKPRPKMTPESLMRAVIDPEFETYFSKRARLTGKKGTELPELLSLLHTFEGWARVKFPFLSFPAFVQQAEKFGSTKKINDKRFGYLKRWRESELTLENFDLDPLLMDMDDTFAVTDLHSPFPSNHGSPTGSSISATASSQSDGPTTSSSPSSATTTTPDNIPTTVIVDDLNEEDLLELLALEQQATAAEQDRFAEDDDAMSALREMEAEEEEEDEQRQQTRNQPPEQVFSAPHPQNSLQPCTPRDLPILPASTLPVHTGFAAAEAGAANRLTSSSSADVAMETSPTCSPTTASSPPPSTSELREAPAVAQKSEQARREVLARRKTQLAHAELS